MEEGDTSCPRMYGHLCKYHWRGMVLFLAPLVYLPLIVPNYNRPSRAAYILAVMATYWMTNAIPMFVTGLMPFFAAPLLGVLDTNQTTKMYMTPTLTIFLGSTMVALALDHSNLANRAAIGLISTIGCSPKRLLLSLILASGIASMFIQNTAVTALMIPITKSVLDEFEAGGLSMREEKKPGQEEEDREASPVATAFYLAVTYAATIGGCGTLIGSATHLSFKGVYEVLYTNATQYITFPAFTALNLPWVMVALFLLYYVLLLTHLGLFRPKSETGSALSNFTRSSKDLATSLKQKYEDMGSTKISEIQIAILFLLLLVLLFFQSPGVMNGWADAIQAKRYIIDATPVIAIVLMLFYLPVNYGYFKYCCGKGPFTKTLAPLLPWKYVNTNFPWGIVFVLGGGYALALAFVDTELSCYLQDNIKGLDSLPLPVLQVFAVVFGALVSTCCANVAASSVVVPIIGNVARNVKTHPLNLIFPAGLGCSIAFLLPISSPGNALVAKHANISAKKMAIAGIAPTIISILLISISCIILIPILYPDTKDFPNWAIAEAQKK